MIEVTFFEHGQTEGRKVSAKAGVSLMQAALAGVEEVLDRHLLGPVDDVLDHRAGVEVLEVQDLLVAVGVGDLEEPVLVGLHVHPLNGAPDHRLAGGVGRATVLREVLGVQRQVRGEVLAEDVAGRLRIRALERVLDHGLRRQADDEVLEAALHELHRLHPLGQDGDARALATRREQGHREITHERGARAAGELIEPARQHSALRVAARDLQGLDHIREAWRRLGSCCFRPDERDGLGGVADIVAREPEQHGIDASLDRSTAQFFLNPAPVARRSPQCCTSAIEHHVVGCAEKVSLAICDWPGTQGCELDPQILHQIFRVAWIGATRG